MKLILLDMNDMSDSREVYESRPHPFFVLFIYLLMVLVAVALLWAALFKIDIVVKGTGTVSAREDSSVITNTYAGAITKCNIADGQEVKKGDILYEVEAKNWDLQLNNYNTQLEQNEDRLVMMEAYLSWLMDNSVDMSSHKDNPYYDEYAARQKIVSLQMDLAQSEFSTQKEIDAAKRRIEQAQAAKISMGEHVTFSIKINNTLEDADESAEVSSVAETETSQEPSSEASVFTV